MLFVPDRSPQVEWPEQVKRHTQQMEDFLDEDFFSQMKQCWNAIGDEEKISEPKESFSDALMPSGKPDEQLTSDSETTGKLSGHVQKMQRAFEALRESENGVIPLLGEGKRIRKDTENALIAMFETLTGDAQKIPGDGMSEDMHILQYATGGMKGARDLIEKAKKDSDEASGPQDKTNSELADLKKQVENLKNQLGGNGNPDLETPRTPQTPPAPQMPQYPRDPNDPTSPPDPQDLDDIRDPSDLDSPSPEDDPSRIGDDTPTDGTDPTQDPTNPPQQPGMGAGGMGGMGGMIGPMMQMMRQQAMQRQMADQDMNKKGPEVDPQRAGPAPAPAPKPAPAPAQSAAPAGNQPANAAPPPGANSGQPAGAPPQQPGPDGSMEFTFEDGRTVKVSEPVYHALEGATGNAEGTDAQAAYEQTPVKWSDPKEIGAGVDPFDLMTGDVAVWEDRTAIVVVFGSEGGNPEQGNAGQGNAGNGTLELVVDGKLTEFDGSKADEMSDNNGEFGSFVGFKHPQGIELKGPQESQAAAAPGSEGDEPSGMANMPAAPA